MTPERLEELAELAVYNGLTTDQEFELIDEVRRTQRLLAAARTSVWRVWSCPVHGGVEGTTDPLYQRPDRCTLVCDDGDVCGHPLRYQENGVTA